MSIRCNLLAATCLTTLAILTPAQADDLILNGGETLVLDSGDSELSYVSIYVGENVGGNTLTLTNKATLFGNFGYIGPRSSDNKVIVTDGAQWLIGGTSPLSGQYLGIGGGSSNNTLEVSKGGKVTSLGYIGVRGGLDASNNEVVVSESGELSAGRQIALIGTGSRLTVRSGGQVQTAELFIGHFPGSKNVASFEGVGARVQTNLLTVGNYSAYNEMLISSGAQVISSQGVIGRRLGSRNANGNSITVTGSGTDAEGNSVPSEWIIQQSETTPSLAPDLSLGLLGSSSNSLTISSGGRVSVAGSVYVGGSSASTDNVISVSGKGSSLTAGGALQVGGSGDKNAVQVKDGGALTTGSASIGRQGNRGNTVDVTGGAQWTVNGDLSVNDLPPSSSPVGTPPQSRAEWNSMHIGPSGRVDVAGHVQVYGQGAMYLGNSARLEAGSLTLHDGSFLSLYVADGDESNPDLSSLIAVDGTASLDGDLEVTVGSSQLTKNKYTLISAGAITGTFDEFSMVPGIEGVDPKSLRAMLKYSDREVYLSLLSDIGGNLDEGQRLTGNQSRVAGAINDYYNGGGTLDEAFVPLFGLAGRGVMAALDELSGEVGATGGARTAMHANSLLLNRMTAAGQQTRGGSGASSAALAGPDRVILPTADGPDAGGWMMWGSALASTATLPGGGAAGSHDTGSDIYGFATGWDADLSPDTRGGFAIGAGTTNWDVGSGLGSGESAYLALGAHATHRMGDSYLSFAAAYGWNAMSTKRRTSVAGSQTLEADFNAHSLSGRIEAGHRFATSDAMGLTPYGVLQAQSVFMPGYDETGGAFALSYEENTSTALRSELGFAVDAALSDDGTARAFGKLAWAHDWASGPTVSASFETLPGASFIVTGAEAPANLALVSLGAEVDVSGTATLAASLDGEFGKAYQSYAGSLSLNIAW